MFPLQRLTSGYESMNSQDMEMRAHSVWVRKEWGGRWHCQHLCPTPAAQGQGFAVGEAWIERGGQSVTSAGQDHLCLKRWNKKGGAGLCYETEKWEISIPADKIERGF